MSIESDSKLAAEAIKQNCNSYWSVSEDPPVGLHTLCQALESGEKVIVTKALLDAREAVVTAAAEFYKHDPKTMRSRDWWGNMQKALAQLEAAKREAS